MATIRSQRRDEARQEPGREAKRAGMDAQQNRADIPPHVIRQLLHVVQERGRSPARLCNGLGFTLRDLKETDFRVSYRQTRQIVQRAMRLLADPAVGLATGARQTPVSWGLPGLGMLTCPNLAAAIDYGIKYQREAGTLTHVSATIGERHFTIEGSARFPEPELEAFFIEEMLAGAVALGRCLIGPEFRPLRVELRYPRPAYAAALRRFFACPVEYGAPVNRLVAERAWCDKTLPMYDEFICGSIQNKIDQALRSEVPQPDFVEIVCQRIRTALPELPSLTQVAAALNHSERTLRRRLGELDVSYQVLVDRIRYESALDLLQRTQLPLQGIAVATGFSDARNFRRAFKRWSGVLPTQIRQGQSPGGRSS
jgi:AraC-like DNA-binding protein